MTSNLPPSSFTGVLTLTSSSVIDAPIDKVWDILCDFQSYSEWNDFVHVQTIVDSKTQKPLPDQTPREGQYLLMEVHLPPSTDRSHPPSSRPLELVTTVDRANHRISWVNCMPSWLIRAERWQALSTTADGKTLYETREVMGRVGAYVVRFQLYADLQKGFQAVADGLKKRAEQL